MVIRTMGLQGDSAQLSQLVPLLARQSSFYSLTLDEVQNHLGSLGKPVGSMNLDELLKNVQANENNVAVASSSALQHQPRLAFDSALSNKTVDQVWRDIQKSNEEKRAEQQRQVSLGEMTLENFLVEGGVVAQSSSDMNNASQTPHAQQQNQWLQYQVPPYQQQQVQNPPQQNVMSGFVPGSAVSRLLPVVAGQRVEITYPDNHKTVTSPSVVTLSDTQVGGCERVSTGEGMEKTTERKQKRMIKNRESAARSRAEKQIEDEDLTESVILMCHIDIFHKEGGYIVWPPSLNSSPVAQMSDLLNAPTEVTKEAYTSELEIKVSLLEEENEMLKKQQELERMLQCAPLPKPKFQLRRTSSALF